MGPSRINPLLWLPAVTLVIRALRERREGPPLRLPDRLFHDLGGSCAHTARHPPRSWKPGVPSRSNPRVNHLRALCARDPPRSLNATRPGAISVTHSYSLLLSANSTARHQPSPGAVGSPAKGGGATAGLSGLGSGRRRAGGGAGGRGAGRGGGGGGGG